MGHQAREFIRSFVAAVIPPFISEKLASRKRSIEKEMLTLP
jgi:hypothetical protein